MSNNTPAWTDEFLRLVRNEIREQVVSNTTDPAFQLMWAKRPVVFVEGETDKLLIDALALLPSWLALEKSTSGKDELAIRWSGLAQSQKRLLAKSFKEFYYKERKLHVRE